MDVTSPLQPTVLGAIWRYRWLVGLIILLAVLLGAAYAIGQPAQHQATVTLIVEDPRASALFDAGSTSRPERYVSTQASIITSGLVSRGAIALAESQGLILSPADIAAGIEVRVISESDEIAVIFTSASSANSVTAVNAVAVAYEEVRLDAISKSFDAAIEQLDSSIKAIGDRLATIANQIDTLLRGEPSRSELDQQYRDALARLSELQGLLATGDSEDPPTLRTSLDDVLQQLQTMEVLIKLEQSSPELAALLEEQSQVISRRADLRSRRDGLAVDASLESTGIVLFSPAVGALEVGGFFAQGVAAALVLGALVATATAYLLAVRNRRFSERNQPEQVLGVPLLTEIPKLSESKVGELPVRDHQSSGAAEAFRFAVPALSRASLKWRETGDVDEPRSGPGSFVIVSAAAGDGKSVVTANLALSAALQGLRVLAVDADFGNQQLTALLGYRGLGHGLTDLDERYLAKSEIFKEVKFEGFPSFDLVSRGQTPITAPEFFGSDSAKSFFSTLGSQYEVILIDGPPLLQVAYASTLVQLSDMAVVVVPHGSSVGRLEEVNERLQFFDTEALGYIYTKAPSRNDLPPNEGSMKDVLGVGRRGRALATP